jgi:hypothetical protein
MKRSKIGGFALLALVASSSPVVAQQGAAEITPAQRQACQGDYNSFCEGVRPGGGRIVACLNKNLAKLSPACRAALQAAER